MASGSGRPRGAREYEHWVAEFSGLVGTTYMSSGKPDKPRKPRNGGADGRPMPADVPLLRVEGSQPESRFAGRIMIDPLLARTSDGLLHVSHSTPDVGGRPDPARFSTGTSPTISKRDLINYAKRQVVGMCG